MFLFMFFLFFKHKTAYELRISDCSSDVVLFRSRKHLIRKTSIRWGRHYYQIDGRRETTVRHAGLVPGLRLAWRPRLHYTSSNTAPTSRRSEERRVGKECVSTCRSPTSPHHYKQQQHPHHHPHTPPHPHNHP